MFRFSLFGVFPVLLVSVSIFQVCGLNNYFFDDVITRVPRPGKDFVVQYRGLEPFYNDDIPLSICIKYFQSKANVNQKPSIVYSPINIDNKEVYYTILMVDPDAPSARNPIFADYLHWGLVNVRGDWLERGITGYEKNLYNELIEYNPPTPPPFTNQHHYQMILMKQNRFIDPKTIETPKKRNNFNTTDFREKYDLQCPIKIATFVTEDLRN